MAPGEHYTPYQRSLINRFYEHADTRTVSKLQELVSELFLATDEKTIARHWKSAAAALAKSPADPAKVEKLVAARDLKQLAELVAQLAPGGKLDRR